MYNYVKNHKYAPALRNFLLSKLRPKVGGRSSGVVSDV